MKDLSLHLLDIAQNSIRAEAEVVEIGFELGENGLLVMTVKDDGCGMDAELLERVKSPFTTTRTTRKIGLGIPMLMQNAIASGGGVDIQSEPGKGTLLTATFDTSSIDCLPLGDLPATLVTLITANPEYPEFHLRCSSPEGEMTFTTEEVRAALGPEVPLNEPDIAMWMEGAISEELTPILGRIMK